MYHGQWRSQGKLDDDACTYPRFRHHLDFCFKSINNSLESIE